MIDYCTCAVCGGKVNTYHEVLLPRPERPGERVIRTGRYCSTDASHAYGTRGVPR